MTTSELHKRRRNGKPEPVVPEMLSLPREIIALPWHEDANTILDIGKPPLLLLVGDPGLGKSWYARSESLRRTGHEPLVLSGSPETDASHLWGRLGLVNNETVWVDGPLPQALKTRRFLLIEEFSLIPLETRSSLMELALGNTVTNPLNGEVIAVPDEFRLIATSNSEAITSCRRNSGIAQVLLERFQILQIPDLSDKQVRDFLLHQFTIDEYPQVDLVFIDRVVRIFNDWRDFQGKGGSSAKSHLSYRAAEHLARLLERNMPEQRAIEIAILGKLIVEPELHTAAILRNSLGESAAQTEEENKTSEGQSDDSEQD